MDMQKQPIFPNNMVGMTIEEAKEAALRFARLGMVRPVITCTNDADDKSKINVHIKFKRP